MSKVKLYINDSLADIDDNSLIVMNYTAEELSNPTVVKNSYSQTVALPATRNNNIIFDHIFRADHLTEDGKFNANVRTPFQLMSDKGEMLEEGYLKLDTIDREGDKVTYNCTLYGGLGSLFYALTYADDTEKDKLTLADLTYSDNGTADVDLDFTINKSAVHYAWEEMDTPTTASDRLKWHIINFAPAYNGVPDGNFDASKAVVYADPDNLYGFDNTGTDDDGNTYGTYNGSSFASGDGWVLADLGEDRTEWQMKDLRSYLQRPVIKFAKILDAIKTFATAKGMTLKLDSSFFASSNPYYADTWLTLPMLTAEEHKATSTTLTLSMSQTYTSGGYADYQIGVTGSMSGMQVDVAIQPTIKIRCAHDTDRTGHSWRLDQYSGLGSHNDRGIFVQVYAKNSNGDVVGASVIQPILAKYGNADADTFVEKNASAGIDLGIVGTEVADTAYCTALSLDSFDTLYDYYTLPYFNNLAPTIEMSASNVATLWVRVTWATEKGSTTDRMAVWKTTSYDDNTLKSCSTATALASYTATASTYEIIRSGSKVTKEMLLGSTQTPADYLLSYAKKFGLVFEYEKGTKTITLMTRSAYYASGTEISLAERIDYSQKMESTPFIFDKKWYEFTEENEDGKFAEYYKEEYDRTYGSQRVNTGYVFNSDTEELLEDNAFKGACEVQEQDTMFELITQGSKDVCVPTITGDVTYKLYYDNGGTVTTLEKTAKTPTVLATITYYDNIYKGYDLFDKVQLHDSDNGSVDGEDVLLFYNGCINSYTTLYKDFRITDDNTAMYVLNGDNYEGNGTPCWLVDFTNITAFMLPKFSRFVYSAGKVVSHSLEMGTPKEVDIPEITLPASASVYDRGWRRYLADRYDKDTRIVKCKVWMSGLKVGAELLKNCYWFDNSMWVMNRIINWSFTTSEVAECEFVKVQDKANYVSGQDYVEE